MGCFVTTMLAPQDIAHTIMLSIPNGDTKVMKRRMIDYFSIRGLKVNQQGITKVKRSSGQTQKIGPSFWQELDKFDPNHSFTQFSKMTDLLIIHPQNDEIIGHEALSIYKDLPNAKYIEVSGDHSFKQQSDRQQLIKIINNFLIS